MLTRTYGYAWEGKWARGAAGSKPACGRNDFPLIHRSIRSPTVFSLLCMVTEPQRGEHGQEGQLMTRPDKKEQVG